MAADGDTYNNPRDAAESEDGDENFCLKFARLEVKEASRSETFLAGHSRRLKIVVGLKVPGVVIPAQAKTETPIAMAKDF